MHTHAITQDTHESVNLKEKIHKESRYKKADSSASSGVENPSSKVPSLARTVYPPSLCVYGKRTTVYSWTTLCSLKSDERKVVIRVQDKGVDDALAGPEDHFFAAAATGRPLAAPGRRLTLFL